MIIVLIILLVFIIILLIYHFYNNLEEFKEYNYTKIYGINNIGNVSMLKKDDDIIEMEPNNGSNEIDNYSQQSENFDNITNIWDPQNY